MEIGEYCYVPGMSFNAVDQILAKKNRTKFSPIFFGPSSMGRVGVSGFGLGFNVVFWAVLDIFHNVVLVGRTRGPNQLLRVPYFILDNKPELQ